ncbi:MAG: RadC family protein [Alphaproteobacteria bacterium]
MTEDTPQNTNQGHRQRLRERFMKGGADAVADYELLELILFLTNPRKDMKPLAKELLNHFGSFNKIVTASPTELQKIKGIGETATATFKIIQAAAIKLSQEKIMNQHIFSSWKEIISYCRTSMAHSQVEQFRLIFLDAKNKLIKDEVQQEGTINETAIYPREIIKRALEVGAMGVVMVHNHPSGDPTPSKADIKMTKKVASIGAELGVTLHDHIVIATTGYFSFKENVLL